MDQVAGCLGATAQGSFNFGYHLVGTSTSPQRFALGVGIPTPVEPPITDNDTFTFNPRIGVSGDYAQTNNCPPTLSAGPYHQRRPSRGD